MPYCDTEGHIEVSNVLALVQLGVTIVCWSEGRKLFPSTATLISSARHRLPSTDQC